MITMEKRLDRFILKTYNRSFSHSSIDSEIRILAMNNYQRRIRQKSVLCIRRGVKSFLFRESERNWTWKRGENVPKSWSIDIWAYQYECLEMFRCNIELPNKILRIWKLPLPIILIFTLGIDCRENPWRAANNSRCCLPVISPNNPSCCGQ